MVWLFLILALLFFGLGFVVKALFIACLAFLAVAVIGALMGRR